MIRRFLIAITALGLLAASAGAACVYFGVYNVAATEQHTAPVYWLLNIAMRRAAIEHSEDLPVPPLDNAARIERGFALYRTHCVNCHGAPGVAPDAFALGMTPVPANLALTGRDWSAAEIYWIVRYGIKMTGMPAWEFRLNDEALWDLVAYVKHLPELSPRDYGAQLRAADAIAEQPQPAALQQAQPPSTLRGDAERGKIAMQQYACVSCHQVPGVVGAVHPVGPPLKGIAHRGFIGGVLPNTRENMVRWLRDPQAVAPHSAMPNLGVSMQHANDLAAYMETLE